MKTIEIISGNQKAQFTTKSVTFDGKEFFYSNMSDVTDHAEQCFYTFTYENESKTLPYEQKDAKILNAIFSQVQNLRTAKSSATADAADRATTKLGAVPGSADSTNKDEAAATKQVAPQETTAETTANTESASSAGTSTEPATEPIADMTSEDPKAAKKAEKERRKAEKLAAKERKLSEKAGNKEDASVDPERKQKLKKSLIIFGVIIAVIAVLSFVYFITFGTDKEPAPVAPSTDESQTYQDIDELTEQLIDQ